MASVSNEGNIKLSRGDSLTMSLFINSGTELSPVRYTLTQSDTVYFAVMEENQLFENAILKKVYTSASDKTSDGDLLLKLRPQDTEDLISGMYKYTVKLKKNTSQTEYDVTTLITEHQFYIM